MRLNLNISLPVNHNTIRADMMINSRDTLKSADEVRLQAVSEEFETLLVEQMIKEMRNNVPESPIFGESRAREIFNDMLDGEYAKIMESRGGIGIAKMMERQLNRDNPLPESVQNSSLLRKTRYEY